MSSSSQVGESWISSFCGLLGHEYFAEVSEDFIEDDFNLTGLQSQVPMYKEALEMILDVEPDDEEDEEDEEEDEDEDDVLGEGRSNMPYRRMDRRHNRLPSDISMIESSAELLYGLIHQRYITSRPGIQQMLEKYELIHFGICPRVYCSGCKVLPVGLSDTPGVETVKLFCPSCLDVYTPPNSRFQTVDGAFFGTTFGCLFFMTFPDLDVNPDAHVDEDRKLEPVNPRATGGASAAQVNLDEPQPPTINGMASGNLAPGLGRGNIYEPRVYGFRVSERSKSGPRMRWLRDRPDLLKDLDEAWHHDCVDDEEEESEEEGVEEGLANGGVAAGDQPMQDAGEGTKVGEDHTKRISARRKSGAEVNGGAVGSTEADGLDDAG